MTFTLYNDTIMNKVVTIQKLIDHSIHLDDAVKHLQCSERTIYRYVKSYKEYWPPWLIHWLQGKRSNNRNKKRELLEYYWKQDRFRWFWPTLLAEKLAHLLWYNVPIESLRRRMIEWWIWLPRKPRSIKRYPRKRKTWYWLMIQFDWSYEDWLENWEIRCMLLWVDDATWDSMHVKFTKNEAINDVIEYWKEYFQKYWKPSVIYLDRHASYKVNHRVDQFDDTTKTRFQTWMNRLWIQVIFAWSAEWKWRVERRFRVLQDRWIKELRLAWIKDYDQAEIYMNETIIPLLNKQFSIDPVVPWNFHLPIDPQDYQQLEWFFAKKTHRKLNKIWIVHYSWNKYLINRWQSLNWTNNVIILESHYSNIQIRNWENQLLFKKYI